MVRTQSVLQPNNHRKLSASYWRTLGRWEAYCELISKGVKPLAEMTLIFSPPALYREHLPYLRQVARRNHVGAAQRMIAKDEKSLALDIVLYPAEDNHSRDKARQLLRLLKEVSRIKERSKTIPLHRQIGRLLGYSNAAIALHVQDLQQRERA